MDHLILIGLRSWLQKLPEMKDVLTVQELRRRLSKYQRHQPWLVSCFLHPKYSSNNAFSPLLPFLMRSPLMKVYHSCCVMYAVCVKIIVLYNCFSSTQWLMETHQLFPGQIQALVCLVQSQTKTGNYVRVWEYEFHVIYESQAEG